VIVETGPASLSMRAVSRRLGVSHAAPANHFPSKEALFCEIARQGLVGLRQALDQAASHEPDPILRLRALGLAYLDYASQHPGHFSVMFRRDLYDITLIENEATATFEVLVDACQAAQHSGWRADADPRGLATLLWSVVHGFAHLEAEGARLEIDRRQLIALVDVQPATPPGR